MGRDQNFHHGMGLEPGRGSKLEHRQQQGTCLKSDREYQFPEGFNIFELWCYAHFLGPMLYVYVIR